MRTRSALFTFIALSMACALFTHPEVVLVPAFLVGVYLLARPRRGWLGGRR